MGILNLFRDESCLYDGGKPGQKVQVFDRAGQRVLRFGNQITQSACVLDEPDRLVLDYTRAMASALAFHPFAEQVLHIGLGAGSVPRFFHSHLPRIDQRVVELDPEVVMVAHQFFGLPRSPRLRITVEDGAEFLRVTPDKYDLIFLDAFHADGIPVHMRSPTLLGLARERLREGGWLVSNVWGSDREALLTSVKSAGAAFQELWAISVRMDSNVILVGGNPARPPSREDLQARAAGLEQRIPLDCSQWIGRIRPARSMPE